MGCNVQLVEYNKWRDSFIGSKRNTIIADDGNCEGYIELLEENGNFQKYFFVLNVQEMKLKCYQDNPKRNSSLLSTVQDLVDILYITKISKYDKSQHGFCFEIQTPSKTFILSAKIQAEMSHWVTAITKAATNPTQSLTNIFQRCDSSPEQSFTTSIIGGVVVKTPVTNVATSNTRGGSLDHRSVENQKNKSNVHSATTGGVKNILEGWCWKQGAVMKNWKRRYFRLSTIRLSYYETDKVMDPIRSIPASNIHNVRILNRFCGRDNMVEVETPSRKFYMHVDDEHEPIHWKDALEKVMIQNGKFLPRTKSV